MRQNIISAAVQTALSLSIAILSIALFRFLSPDQVASIRQHYLVPFAIITALTPANQNYLRSVLFSKWADEKIRHEITALGTVQILGGACLLALVALAATTAETHFDAVSLAALASAILLVSTRTFVGGYLEFNGKYLNSIVLNNLGTAVPYVSAMALVASHHPNVFFIFVITLNTALSISSLVIGRQHLAHWVRFSLPLRENFDFRRYANLCVIAVGSVIIYQGVEFCLYNYTEYKNSDIANYALSFSACAVLRQIIITAVQPLEQSRHYTSRVQISRRLSIEKPLAIEAVIYLGIAGAAVTLPIIFTTTFPAYHSASSFVAPILLGVLGSAVQQIYAVRMITESRTSFLSNSQIILAASCIAVATFGSKAFDLLTVIWLTSLLTWIRGCIVIPLYAEARSSRFAPKMWAFRGCLSLALLAFVFAR